MSAASSAGIYFRGQAEWKFDELSAYPCAPCS